VRRDHGEGIIQGRLVFPADQVWHFISGLGSLPERLPYIPKSELHEGGQRLTRTCCRTRADEVAWSAACRRIYG
jgi:hypothetical protein